MTGFARWVLRCRRLCAAVAAVPILTIAPIDSGNADDFCESIETLIELTPSGFAGLGAPSGRDRGDRGVVPQLDGAERCAVGSQLDGEAYHCVWKFPYRAEEAYAAFTTFDRELRRCIGDSAGVRSDRRVNHPDFYDLRLYELDRARVSVSVKDKGALRSTFVFIRVSP